MSNPTHPNTGQFPKKRCNNCRHKPATYTLFNSLICDDCISYYVPELRKFATPISTPPTKPSTPRFNKYPPNHPLYTTQRLSETILIALFHDSPIYLVVYGATDRNFPIQPNPLEQGLPLHYDPLGRTPLPPTKKPKPHLDISTLNRTKAYYDSTHPLQDTPQPDNSFPSADTDE